MTTFEMVKYHSQSYPSTIPLAIEECAAHFDVTSVNATLKQSLHTEYSYGKRKFDSGLMHQFPTLRVANKADVPQLWKDELWAAEFASFVIALADNEAPAVIEVHPPFTDYATFESFIGCYKVFEDEILAHFPDVSILIENRCGSVYKGGKFLVSKLSEVETLCNMIVQHGLQLKIAFDVPQIYTAHNVKKRETYIDLLQNTQPLRDQIGGVHLWGKRRSDTGRLVSHCGDLNSYFEQDMSLKKAFLQAFVACFDDNTVRRMVLEVNSGNEDLLSIVSDLMAYGVNFV